MFRELRIADFQGFAGLHEAQLAPLTVIVGPNSSGKSALIHSLLLLAQSVETRAGSAEPVSFRGPLVDVGGFRALVHGHDFRRSISIGFTWEDDVSLSREGSDDSAPSQRIVFETQVGWSPGSRRALATRIRFDEGHDKQRFYFNTTTPSERIMDGDEVGRLRLALNGRLKAWLVREIEQADELATRGYLDALEQEIDALVVRVAAARSSFDEAEESRLEAEGNRGRLEADLKRIRNQAQVQQRLLQVDRQQSADATLIAETEFQRSLREMQRLDAQYADSADKAILAAERSRAALNELSHLQQEVGHVGEQLDRLKSLEGKQKKQRTAESERALGKLRFAPDGLFPRYLPDMTATRDAPDVLSVGRLVSEELERLVHALRHSLSSVRYLGPFRQAPKRFEVGEASAKTYVGAGGEMTAGLLDDLPWVSESVNTWLARMEIPYAIRTRQISDQDYPSLGDLRTLELTDRRTETPVSTTDVGFGISQVLPVIVQSLLAGPNRQVLVVEQPEVHLHPRLQAELGDLFIEACVQGGQVVAETHSESLILRLQRRVREGVIPPSLISVIYVGATSGRGSYVQHLPIGPRGEFLEEWPDGFFEERYNEWGGAR